MDKKPRIHHSATHRISDRARKLKDPYQHRVYEQTDRQLVSQPERQTVESNEVHALVHGKSKPRASVDR